jgi:acetyl esterase/lipase
MRHHLTAALGIPSPAFAGAAIVLALLAGCAAGPDYHGPTATAPAASAAPAVDYSSRNIFEHLAPEARSSYQAAGFRLWDGRAPGATGDAESDIPELYPVLPATHSGPMPVILVLPGGGYNYLSDYEAFPIAEHFRDLGLAAFVLKYRLKPYDRAAALLDVQRAVRLLRARAAEFGLDPSRVAVVGFSAGGHLAANLSTHGDDGNPQAADPIDRQSCRLQTALLIYPGILDKKPVRTTADDLNIAKIVQLPGLQHFVDAKTPPTFMVVAYGDQKALRENDLAYVAMLEQAGVRFELHILGQGDHGFSMRVKDPRMQIWQQMATNWLTTCGFLPEPVFEGPKV